MEVSLLKQTAFEPKTISPTNGKVSAGNDTNIDDAWDGVDRELPIIDYTMFMSVDPAQRSKVIQDLGKWCQEYGFFIVKNHPVPENLIKETIDKFMEFFDQTEEEKLKYSTRDPDDRIRFFQGDKNIVSREYLYVSTHPTLHCPPKPPTLPETVKEFSGRVRELGIELLKGISESLGYEEDYIEKKLNLKSSFDFITVNDYPARQSSTNRLGQVEHSDTGAFTLVTQNTNGGLQLEHNGQWINVNIKANWIACNVADFLEILTNGKYKSVVHRVVLNSEVRRVTPPLFIGPALDTYVCPAPEFVNDTHPPGYLGMTYRQYLELNDHQVIDGRSWLQQVRL